jgi:hypothetical protein
MESMKKDRGEEAWEVEGHMGWEGGEEARVGGGFMG